VSRNFSLQERLASTVDSKPEKSARNRTALHENAHLTRALSAIRPIIDYRRIMAPRPYKKRLSAKS
jgi:hypothetical protein